MEPCKLQFRQIGENDFVNSNYSFIELIRVSLIIVQIGVLADIRVLALKSVYISEYWLIRVPALKSVCRSKYWLIRVLGLSQCTGESWFTLIYSFQVSTIDNFMLRFKNENLNGQDWLKWKKRIDWGIKAFVFTRLYSECLRLPKYVTMCT